MPPLKYDEHIQNHGCPGIVYDSLAIDDPAHQSWSKRSQAAFQFYWESRNSLIQPRRKVALTQQVLLQSRRQIAATFSQTRRQGSGSARIVALNNLPILPYKNIDCHLSIDVGLLTSWRGILALVFLSRR